MRETDLSTCDPVEELRSRLTRGGLSPEAVEKAAKAYEAGDVHALNLAYYKVPGRDEKHLICPIPEELLTRVFPELAKVTPNNVDLVQLEYEINRHRGGVQSITIRFPNARENAEAPEPEKPAPTPETSGFEILPETVDQADKEEAPADTKTGTPPDDDDLDWMREDEGIDNPIDDIAKTPEPGS